MLKLSFIRYLPVFIILFFLIFRIKIGFIDLTPIIFLVSLVLFLLCKGSVNRKFLNFLFFYMLFMSYRLLVIIINSDVEIESYHILRDVRFLLSSLSVYFIFYLLLLKSKYHYRDLISIISLVLLCHPVLMYVQLFSPEVRLWFVQNLPFTDNYHSFRVNGFLNGYVPGGNFLGLISVYFFFLYYKEKKKIYLLIPLSFLPLFPVSGLSGLGTFIFGLLYFIFLKSRLKNKLYFMISIIFSIVIVFGNYSFIKENLPDLAKGLDRVVILFAPEKVDNNVNASVDGSLNVLLNSYKLPESSVQILFGNAQSSKTEFSTTSSDSGIVSIIHSFGFFGLFLVVVNLLLMYKLANNELLFALTISMLIMCVKIDLFFSRIVFDFIMCIFVISILECRANQFFVSRVRT